MLAGLFGSLHGDMGARHAQSGNKAESICSESVGMVHKTENELFPVYERKLIRKNDVQTECLTKWNPIQCILAINS